MGHSLSRPMTGRFSSPVFMSTMFYGSMIHKGIVEHDRTMWNVGHLILDAWKKFQKILSQMVTWWWFTMLRNWFWFLERKDTLPETNSSHLKIGRAPKGNDSIPNIHFQVRTVSFREGNSSHLKMDGKGRLVCLSFFGCKGPVFRGYVSFREGC